LPYGAKLLSIILYSDATTTDVLGKNQLHPIYMSIGNIPTWRRNKPDAKQLLAYLPILKSNLSKNLSRETFHKSIQHLLEPISSDNSLELTINNETFWFYPRVSVIIADWPEAATFCLTYKSSNSNFPCHFCMVRKNDLSNIDLRSSDIRPRTHEAMRKHFDENTGRDASIESVPNFFWKLP
jgi:Plavaka transposase